MSPFHCGDPHPVGGGGEAVVGGDGAAVVGGGGAVVVVGGGAAVVGVAAHDPDDPYPTRKTQFDTNLKN